MSWLQENYDLVCYIIIVAVFIFGAFVLVDGSKQRDLFCKELGYQERTYNSDGMPYCYSIKEGKISQYYYTEKEFDNWTIQKGERK